MEQLAGSIPFHSIPSMLKSQVRSILYWSVLKGMGKILVPVLYVHPVKCAVNSYKNAITLGRNHYSAGFDMLEIMY